MIMDLQMQFGWSILLILFMGITFYSLGYSTGRKDGHRAGRAIGIRIGERRSLDRQVNK